MAAAHPAGEPAKVDPELKWELSPKISSLAEMPASGAMPPDKFFP